MTKKEEKCYKPGFNEFLGCYYCGNPYCGYEINEHNKDKCPDCGNIHDWGEDK